MSNALSIVLGLSAMLLPILFLCHRNNRANLQKSLRAKQFVMPIIAVIYSVLVMFLSEQINDLVYSGIMSVPVLIYRLGTLLGLESAFTSAASSVLAMLNSLNWSIWLAYIVCFCILLVYIELKRTCLGLIRKLLCKKNEAGHSVYDLFYEMDQDNGCLCIKESFVDVRKLFKILYYAGAGIACMLMVVSGVIVTKGEMSNLFYPVYAMMILGELYFFLNGYTKREYNSDVLGEDEEAVSVINYALLRNILRKIFSGKAIDEGTSINSELEHGMTNEEVLSELEKDADPAINTFAKFYKNKLSGDFQLDHNYLYSSLDLLKGKSILFNNPFYNDLIPYAFYPMNRKLLEHKKVLIVLGRQGIENDIETWVYKGIQSITNVPYFWNVGVLGEEEFNGDIGILPRAEVTNAKIQEKNLQFLKQVEFVIILEPSKLITTAQIGLKMLIKKCIGDDQKKNITFCMSDKNSDGLVDAISHILLTSIEEVSATNKHKGTVSHMCWQVDGEHLQHRIVPNISRYLGIGTELSFAALKYQIGKAKWYGGETFPVVDMNWISKQYYFDLMKYAGLPANQDMMNRKFITSANYWGASAEKNAYITVEDEYFNIFEILRNFSTRSTSQGFVNVISPQYLLRDYMADNASIFETDAKAIPNISADYAKTTRNTTLAMLLQLCNHYASQEMLEKEFSLLGITVFDIPKQLWFEIFKCFAGAEVINTLSEKYEDAVETAYEMKISTCDSEFGSEILTVKEEYNYSKGINEIVYKIENDVFINNFVGDLKSASYVAEDEAEHKNYLGSELICQIYQRILPGQFLTLSGKYYEMRYLSSGNEIVVRRAADHIDNRYSYKQLRNYFIAAIRSSKTIGADRVIEGMRISKEYADIAVETPGYYKMIPSNNFAQAMKILYEGEDTGIPARTYKNKPILRIQLPQNEKLDDKVRYTITLLFNEVFQSLFAENQAYISAVSVFEKSAEKEPMTYSLTGDAPGFDSNCIYIIEDSQLDLGLLESVERNLKRIFEIVCDYLQWHSEALEKSKNLKPEYTDEEMPEFTDFKGPEKVKKRSIFTKIKELLKKLFMKDKKDKNNNEDKQETDVKTEPEFIKKMSFDETPSLEETLDNEETPSFGEPINSEELLPEDDVIDFEQPEIVKNIKPELPYHQRYFTLYGFEKEPENIDTSKTLEYLTVCGFLENSLKQAREGKNIADLIEASEDRKEGTRSCDFCNRKISGVEFETLIDGRERCTECSRTAIKTEEEFKEIYAEVKRNMESFYGIKINAGIRVQMVNAQRLHKKIKKRFIPTSGYDSRILGVAIQDREGFSILIENGAPRMQSMLTIVHELTHIWQYKNWNSKQIRAKYGEKLELEIYEGMSKWAEIQYAYLINEPSTAMREELITHSRDDEYGRGLLRYSANYKITHGSVITEATPFDNREEPLALEFCGEILRDKVQENLCQEVNDEDGI